MFSATVRVDDYHQGQSSHMRKSKIDLKSQDLRRLAVLNGCSDEQLQKIAALTTRVSLPAGRDLCRQGTIGRECFLIADGNVSVSKAGHEVAVLGPGAVVGEMALISHKRRTATVTTLTPTTGYVLTSHELGQVLDIAPVARRLAETVASRAA